MSWLLSGTKAPKVVADVADAEHSSDALGAAVAAVVVVVVAVDDALMRSGCVRMSLFDGMAAVLRRSDCGIGLRPGNTRCSRPRERAAPRLMTMPRAVSIVQVGCYRAVLLPRMKCDSNLSGGDVMRRIRPWLMYHVTVARYAYRFMCIVPHRV